MWSEVASPTWKRTSMTSRRSVIFPNESLVTFSIFSILKTSPKAFSDHAGERECLSAALEEMDQVAGDKEV